MQLLPTYLIKLSVCLGSVYLFYHILLRRLTFYNWNRFFLLFAILFASLVPFLHTGMLPVIGGIDSITLISSNHTETAVTTNLTGTPSSAWNWSVILYWVFISGAVFFTLRLLLRLYSLYRTRQPAKLIVGDEIRLYHLPGTTAPFSFGNSIYLDTQLYNEQELEKIIEHELVHVQQQHTADMLLGEALCIVQWYNPFAWLLKHAIRQNLEFVADDGVLQKGIGRKSYQYLLLKVTGAIPDMPVNNLLYPSLKKRIEMMNRDRSGKKQLLRFACILPLMLVLLAAFSTREIQTAPVPVPGMAPGETFHLGKLSYAVNDASVAALVQQAQGKSFLKPGGLLSLALIQQEKTRLTNLLAQNGYDNATSSKAIRFVMDTAATGQDFSVQVTIHLPETANPVTKTNDTKQLAAAKHRAISDEDNAHVVKDILPGKITPVQYAETTGAEKQATAARLTTKP